MNYSNTGGGLSPNDALKQLSVAYDELKARVTHLEKLVHYPYMAGKEQVERITALEKQMADLTKDPGHTHPNVPNWADTNMKQLAAQVEATKDLYAPLRSNVDPLMRLSHFARRLLDPHDLGHAVTFEVRELAREALGKEKQG